MKIYKDKQFLVFDLEDGNTVKYDFATKKAIGKRGKPVKNLKSQLQGLTINELCSCCTDKQYGKFLRFVKKQTEYDNGYNISNIGTILDRVPNYAKFEQIFSAGIEDIVDSRYFNYSINEIPKGLIKICREHKIKISNDYLKYWKETPDAHLLGFNLEYISLTDEDIYNIHTACKYIYIEDDRAYRYYNRREKCSTFNLLIEKFGYTAKALMLYLDHLKTFEALEYMESIINELYDYANMMSQISPKFDKYPRNFLTAHKIAARNYNRLKIEFDEMNFKSRINKEMERTIGEYRFIYPDCTQDIKNEAVAQNNCVASYIQKVIDGGCHIMFLRYKDSPDESLVTLEIQNNKVVQSRQRFNDPCTKEQKEVIAQWEKWLNNKFNTKENDERKELVAC